MNAKTDIMYRLAKQIHVYEMLPSRIFEQKIRRRVIVVEKNLMHFVCVYILTMNVTLMYMWMYMYIDSIIAKSICKLTTHIKTSQLHQTIFYAAVRKF